MPQKILLLLAAQLSVTGLYAQDTPYFQQKVDTRIDVRLDDVRHLLQGSIEIHYTNNSPDTLQYLYFHLYPNAYSSDRTAYEQQAVANRSTAHYLAGKEDWGYMDSLKFRIDEMPGRIVTTDDPDIIKVLLPSPILPGGQAVIATPFRVKIPKTFSRMGHQGQSYQISQWFPKPAVYDARGWHPYPYLDQGEFYSEYGSYDVRITLPENYVVMATGNLRTPSEEQWLAERAAQPLPEKTDTTRRKAIPSATRMKTIRYTEDQVHDFAWFADKRWVVRKDTLQVPGNNQVTTVYTAFSPENVQGWAHATESVKMAVSYYSKMVGAYPYHTVKAVEGSLRAGGGMEYPTVTVIAPGYGAEQNHEVIIHEVGHNWFYGILGSDERMHPWMDEGINSFYEHLVTALPFEPLERRAVHRIGRVTRRLSYTAPMAQHTDQAVGLPAYAYTNATYGGDVYGKAPAYLELLSEYMGVSDFTAAMQDYYRQWQFRHPQPKDFEAVIRKHTGRNVDWFFADGLHSDLGVDFAIGKRRKTAGGTLLTVKNKTGIGLPLALQVDSAAQYLWVPPFTGKQQVLIPDTVRSVGVAALMPDYNLSNNQLHKGPAIRGGVGPEQAGRQTTWILPAFGYNVYDRFMLGLTLHNLNLPEKSVQYAVVPMYGFGSKTLVGTGMLSKAWYPQGKSVQEIDLNLEGKRYAYRRTQLDYTDNPVVQFVKIAPELRIIFKKPEPRSTLERYLSLKGYYIREGKFRFDQNPADSLYYPEKDGADIHLYGRLQFGLEQRRTFNPYGLLLEAQAGKDFVKIAAEAHLKIDYFYRKKAVYLRAFAGKMFTWGDASALRRYGFNATYSGWNDYLYDQTYFGRNMQSGLAAQQIALKDGGMKIPTLLYSNPIGLTTDWMTALNLKIDLPVGIPLQVFADVLTFAKAKESNPDQSRFLYDAGLSLRLTPYLDIHVPILMSPEYSTYKTSVLGKNAFGKMITFSINLDKVYWPRLQRTIRIF